MANTNDAEVMLSALGKERQELHQRIMHIDRIIKKVRTGDYLPVNINVAPKLDAVVKPDKLSGDTFPKQADLRIQILKVFDILKKATKLQDVQTEYDKLNGNHYPLRDSIRGLQTAKLLVMIKVKTATRGFLWAKTEWLENGQLMDEYKPEGFDLLYKPENLIYE